MFTFRSSEAVATLAALGRSLAVIEFKPDGTILNANPNFLAAVGYTLPEVQGVITAGSLIRSSGAVRAMPRSGEP